MPQLFYKYGRGDDWVGGFLLSQHDDWRERYSLLANWPFIAGRYLAALVLSSTTSVIGLDVQDFKIYRLLNLVVLALIALSLNHVMKVLRYSVSVRAVAITVSTALPGMQYWVTATGSYAYLLGALAAVWAGFALTCMKKTTGFLIAMGLAILSVLLYQTTLMLIFVAPAAAILRPKLEDRSVVRESAIRNWTPVAVYLTTLYSNRLIVEWTGLTERLESPSFDVILERLYFQLIPRIAVPWLVILEVEQNYIPLVASGLLCVIITASWFVLSKIFTTDRRLSFICLGPWLAIVVYVLLVVTPLVFTQQIAGTRTTVFASVFCWTAFVCVIDQLITLFPKSRLLSVASAWMFSILAVLVPVIYLLSTVIPAAHEWQCSVKASKDHKYPTALPVGLQQSKFGWITANDEWIITSLGYANAIRFQTLASYGYLGISPGLSTSIWDVPFAESPTATPEWNQSFSACLSGG